MYVASVGAQSVESVVAPLYLELRRHQLPRQLGRPLVGSAGVRQLGRVESKIAHCCVTAESAQPESTRSSRRRGPCRVNAWGGGGVVDAWTDDGAGSDFGD